MKQFIAVVHKDADSAFGVHFPDVPGCFSAADDMDKVLPNAIEALSLWFEDEPMVEPGDFDAVRTTAADDLAAGAILMAIPYVERPTRPVSVNISIERGVVDAIDTVARQRGQTRSAFITEASLKEIGGSRIFLGSRVAKAAGFGKIKVDKASSKAVRRAAKSGAAPRRKSPGPQSA